MCECVIACVDVKKRKKIEKKSRFLKKVVCIFWYTQNVQEMDKVKRYALKTISIPSKD